MVSSAEQRIQLHIFTEIMHPAHIPLVCEEQAAFFNGACYFRPRCGFLCDHHNPRKTAPDHGIHMLEKFNGFQILIITIFICHPLPVLFTIVQVQHGSNCIHPQSVHMKFLDPEQCVGNQEIHNFIFAVIKYLGSPVRMLSHSRIGMLKQRSAVKLCQAMCVSRKMSRYPVQNHPDLIFMQCIDQIHKILGCAIPGSRRIITGYLISPGTVKRMLRNTHQLHMCKTHFFQIFHNGIRELPIGIKALILSSRMTHPGTDMAFIDGHRFSIDVFSSPCIHPLFICPAHMRQICDNRCRTRSFFCKIGKRVRLI